MKEIRSLDVANEEEIACIEFHQNFGWKYKSSQRIYSKNTRLERWDLSVVSVTETTDFTKVVFERDRETKNYHQLVALEQEYLSLCNRIPDAPPAFHDKCATIEQWAAAAKPTIIKNRAGIFTVLLTAILCGSAVFYDTSVHNAEVNLSSLLMLLIPCFIISMIVSLTFESIRNRTALRSALKAKNSKYRSELERKYLLLLDKIDEYTALVERQSQVFNAATHLVRTDKKVDYYLSEHNE